MWIRIQVWIRIHAIPIPALLDAIPAPDLDPQKSGIVTPLDATVLYAGNVDSTREMKKEGGLSEEKEEGMAGEGGKNAAVDKRAGG